MSTVHVIGGGLAGLAAALALADRGARVVVHEASPQAGGRCRSYHDKRLDCVVDNGNHLLLSGNGSVAAFIDRVGSRDSLLRAADASIAFMDSSSRERWTVRPNAGRIPWWIFSSERRVPGTTARDYLALAKLLRAGPDATVADVLDDGGALYRRLLEPLAVSALNTPARIGSARLLGAIVRETLARGGGACVPLLPRIGWSDSLIDPALAALARAGATIRFGSRITTMDFHQSRLVGLETTGGKVPLDDGDAAVLAVPPGLAAELLPGLVVPNESEAIVNAHFALDTSAREPGFTGLVGGLSEWVFVKPGHVSVTISAAERLNEMRQEELAAVIWPEVESVIGIRQPMPAWRVVRERRATFAATPAQDRRRPAATTAFTNLALAGDWTATGLPATIEGAIRSGRVAADSLASAVRTG